MSAAGGLAKQDFGKLFFRLDGFRHRLRQLPVHVVWLCGEKAETDKEGNATGKLIPSIVGQTKSRLPENCEIMLRVERTINAAGQAVVKVFTRSTGRFDAKVPASHAVRATEVPDMTVILAKLGYLPPDEAEAVLGAIAAESPARVPQAEGPVGARPNAGILDD